MKSVFVVQHLHRLPSGEDSVMFIGVYRTEHGARVTCWSIFEPSITLWDDGFSGIEERHEEEPIQRRTDGQDQNGSNESFNGKFRDECLSMQWFKNRIDAKILIENFRRECNEIRPHSSLGQLKRLPLDKLKIDRSFVADLPHDRYDLAISSGIVGIGKALNLPVVAEGVETAEQLRALRAAGCSWIQGYLVAKPLAAADYAEFARRPHELPA